MKERPILMSAPMVRALLDGSKTQTRRTVKFDDPAPTGTPNLMDNEEPVYWAWGADHYICPYGVPGDRLWVRETFVRLGAVSPASGLINDWGDRPVLHHQLPTPKPGGGHYYGGEDVVWRADGYVEFCDGDGFSGPGFADKDDMPKWTPSIFMPRWACRLTLEVTAVRVERLQEISEGDARAEGVRSDTNDYPVSTKPAISGYRTLWESINGPGSWAANPWVWAISFKRIMP